MSISKILGDGANTLAAVFGSNDGAVSRLNTVVPLSRT